VSGNKQSILVTGANGLLGRAVIDLLCRHDYDLYALVRSLPSVQRSNVNYIIEDLTDREFCTRLPVKIDSIVHLAQSSKYRLFPSEASDIFDVNVGSTAALLHYAYGAGARRFVFASSGGVYGDFMSEVTESEPIRPPSELGYYLATKACGEMLVASYAHFFDVVILRPFFIYGIGQRDDMLISRLINSISKGDGVAIEGEDGLVFNPVHCSDAAKAVEASLSLAGSGTFNVAGPEVLTLREVCQGIAGIINRQVHYVSSPRPARRLVGSIAAMEQHLHKPVVRFGEFLSELTKDPRLSGRAK
jgi:UDP-glucose 4-epimerase